MARPRCGRHARVYEPPAWLSAGTAAATVRLPRAGAARGRETVARRARVDAPASAPTSRGRLSSRSSFCPVLGPTKLPRDVGRRCVEDNPDVNRAHMTYIEIASQGANKNIDFGWNRGFINGVCCTQIVANFRGSQSGNYLNNVPDNTEYEVAYTYDATRYNDGASDAPTVAKNNGGYKEQNDGNADLFIHFRKNGGAWETPPFRNWNDYGDDSWNGEPGPEFTQSTLASRTRLIRLSLAMSAFTMSRSPSPTSRRSTRHAVRALPRTVPEAYLITSAGELAPMPPPFLPPSPPSPPPSPPPRRRPLAAAARWKQAAVLREGDSSGRDALPDTAAARDRFEAVSSAYDADASTTTPYDDCSGMKDAIDNQKELHSSPTNWAALYHQRAREAFHLAFLMKTLRRQSRCTNGASTSARNSATCATEVADRAIRVCKSDSGVYPPALRLPRPALPQARKGAPEPLPEQAHDGRKVVIDQTADGDSGESVLIEMPTADASAAAHGGNAGTVEIGSGPTASCAVTFNDPDRMDWRCVLLGTDDDPLDIALTRGVVAEVFGVGAVYWIDKTAEDAAAGTGGRRSPRPAATARRLRGRRLAAPPPSRRRPAAAHAAAAQPAAARALVVAHHMLPDGTAVQDDYEITVYATSRTRRPSRATTRCPTTTRLLDARQRLRPDGPGLRLDRLRGQLPFAPGRRHERPQRRLPPLPQAGRAREHVGAPRPCGRTSTLRPRHRRPRRHRPRRRRHAAAALAAAAHAAAALAAAALAAALAAAALAARGCHAPACLATW